MNPIAKEAQPPNAGIEKTQYLTFMLGSENFATCILGIKEIIEYVGLTALRMMPECIRGVINMRGWVAPVMVACYRRTTQEHWTG
jgi:purine-binding chemotaxis protein CheW